MYLYIYIKQTINFFIFPRYEFSFAIHVNESFRILISVLLNILSNLSPDIELFIVIWNSNVKHTFLLTMMPLLRGK